MDATPARLTLLRVVAPDDTALAEQAVQRYPDLPQALVWRAGQLEMDNPSASIELYSRALALNSVPYDWWLGLGRAYEQAGDYQAALNAYQTGCDLGVGVIPCHELRRLQQRMKAGQKLTQNIFARIHTKSRIWPKNSCKFVINSCPKFLYEMRIQQNPTYST